MKESVKSSKIEKNLKINVCGLLEMKQRAIELLRTVNREGIDKLLVFLDENGYYITPASTKFHGSYEGGLVDHSMNVYSQFKKHIEAYKIEFPADSIIITALLHDICKINQYIKSGDIYLWNKENDKGHALSSIKRIEKFIKLTDDEKIIIQYHMGLYYTKQFNSFTGEYFLRDMTKAYDKLKVAKLFHFCDDMVSQFIDK